MKCLPWRPNPAGLERLHARGRSARVPGRLQVPLHTRIQFDQIIVPHEAFAPAAAYRPVGTFAFSSSNQFMIRLMCVTTGGGGGVTY